MVLVFCCLSALADFADVVHVFEQTECGGETVQIADWTLETGQTYKTGAAPTKNGWIFTHWTVSTTQDFADRDDWGRAYEAVQFKLYEETALTAHYLPAVRRRRWSPMSMAEVDSGICWPRLLFRPTAIIRRA